MEDRLSKAYAISPKGKGKFGKDGPTYQNRSGPYSGSSNFQPRELVCLDWMKGSCEAKDGKCSKGSHVASVERLFNVNRAMKVGLSDDQVRSLAH